MQFITNSLQFSVCVEISPEKFVLMGSCFHITILDIKFYLLIYLKSGVWGYPQPSVMLIQFVSP